MPAHIYHRPRDDRSLIVQRTNARASKSSVDISLQNCSMSAWLYNEEQQTGKKAKLQYTQGNFMANSRNFKFTFHKHLHNSYSIFSTT